MANDMEPAIMLEGERTLEGEHLGLASSVREDGGKQKRTSPSVAVEFSKFSSRVGGRSQDAFHLQIS